MGTITSRLNLDSLQSSRRRSHQDEPLYSYSLSKNNFSNYFFIGGERFEVNDPDYLFGDNCDLNFLSCTKPYILPYKKAQQTLLSDIKAKQKAANKTSSRVNVSLTTSLNIITGRHDQMPQCRKQDAQTQTLSNLSKDMSHGPEPSQPLIMLMNIRKETLRLVKVLNVSNFDGDLNSLSNNASSPIQTASNKDENVSDDVDGSIGRNKKFQDEGAKRSSVNPLASSSKKSRVYKRSIMVDIGQSLNKYHASTATKLVMNETRPNRNQSIQKAEKGKGDDKKYCRDSDTISSISSPGVSTSTSTGDADDSSSCGESSKSGYTSVKEIPPSSGTDDDDNFQDALNDTANLSSSVREEADDDESERAQQRKSLLCNRINNTKDESDAKIMTAPKIESENIESDDADESSVRITTDSSRRNSGRRKITNGVMYFKRKSGKISRKDSPTKTDQMLGKIEAKINLESHDPIDRVYNIEFQFDCEVDCSIRIFYFCIGEINANGVTYKPQHATYESKTYIYKKGLNQKFEQQEHTFQPYLFDEDLLIYKPLDLEGNFNSGAVFPIVIQCTALEGPQPRQSQSLIATIEKSQLDESYSIKPLKQLIFVDGVQYILQDIYGIENKKFLTHKTDDVRTGMHKKKRVKKGRRENPETSTAPRSDTSPKSSVISIGSNDLQKQHNFSDTESIASCLIIDGGVLNNTDKEEDSHLDNDEINHAMNSNGSTVSVVTANNRFKSINSENNSFECVICMSDERDTMLLPCRHLCLCSSCAQSLRYQANSCPICRCPFKAALNLRVTRSNGRRWIFES